MIKKKKREKKEKECGVKGDFRRLGLIWFVSNVEGTSLVGDKPRSSFSSWSHYAAKQNPNFETTTPWCRLLSQFGQVIQRLSAKLKHIFVFYISVLTNYRSKSN